MKTRVLDSWAILEWMSERQPATDAVDVLLAEAESGASRVLMSAVNAGEVYYILLKRLDKPLAEAWKEYSRALPVTLEVPTLNDVWDAAGLKGRFPMSYADAFAAALAQKSHCPLVTGDPEFRLVEGLELDWIGI